VKVQTGFIKVACAGWVAQEMINQAQQRGVRTHSNVVMGLVDGRLKKWVESGENFIYLDHGYFKRGWANNNFRAIRNACHLNEIKKRPDDRMKKFGVEVEPWRKERGSKIVVIPTYDGHHQIWPGMSSWVGEVKQRMASLTSRPVVVKQEKGNLREYLQDAWCLVCNQSVAGVEAALMGVPVFSTPKCPSWPVSNKLENIECPEFFDNRHEWAASLAYATWNSSEIDEVDWVDYDYALRHDL
jgi:hypothetical protein